MEKFIKNIIRLNRILIFILLIFTSVNILDAQTIRYDIGIKIKVKYFTNVGVFSTTVTKSDFKEGNDFVIPGFGFFGPQLNLGPAYGIIEGGTLKIDEEALNDDLYLEVILDSLDLNSGRYPLVFNEKLFLKLRIDVYVLPDSTLVKEPYYFREGKFFTACFPKTDEFISYVEDDLQLDSDSIKFAFIEPEGFSTKGITTFLRKGRDGKPDSICFSAVHLSKFGGGRGNFITTGLGEDRDLQLPAEFELLQNFPNPFNPSTSIKYHIPESDFISLRIYDILGNQVSVLVDKYQSAGTHEILFDASALNSGVYFYHLRSSRYNAVKKMVILK